MKKVILDFADRLLSNDQMKKVRGGCGGGSREYYCTIVSQNGCGDYSGRVEASSAQDAFGQAMDVIRPLNTNGSNCMYAITSCV
ncbi:MAG: hypothetical protein MUD08_02545 [Cytophagales bacterium]|jgi:hypothetical protein|nr:hypothetical protein [Cytophagales bacterium]